MNPAEQVLRRVDRYQQQHPSVGVPFAVVKRFSDRGGNLTGLLANNGLFAVVLRLLSWLYLGAQLILYAAEVNIVRARRLWPRSLLQPPFTQPDQRALVHLAKQEERRPEQSVEVTFTPKPEPGQPNGSKHPEREP